MAESKQDRNERTGGQTMARGERDRGSLQTMQPRAAWLSNPFEVMDRMSREMDRMFDRMFGDFASPRQSWPSRGRQQTQGLWAPRVEAFQNEDRFTVRAELPGLKKDDVQVEVTDEAITIQGQRRQEHQEEREGYYHSEREYGQFYRSIPLPDGVIADSAKATFKDGVLEIAMQAAPAEATRGRRLEITEAASSEQRAKEQK